MTDGVDPEAALGEFEQARTAFEESVRRAPDAALRFRPPGEDYALGGLVVHVTDVLRRYGELLGAIGKADYGALTAPPAPTTDADAALIRDGFAGEERAAVLDAMRAAHTTLVERARPLDFDRKVDVTYGGSSQPHPTSAADVLGWVLDHYREHTRQIGDLVSAWADAAR